jgi:hypothetical protein
MMLPWPGIPALGYTLTMASMMVFWTLLIFGAIVLVHFLRGENRPAEGRPVLSSSSPGVSRAASTTGGSASSVLAPRAGTGSDPSCSPDGREPRREDRYPSRTSSHREGRLYLLPARQP